MTSAVRGRQNARRVVLKLLLTLIAIVVAIGYLWPIVWMITSSLRNQADIFRYLYPLSLRAMFPVHVTFANFRTLFVDLFSRNILNSLITSIGTVVIGVFICASAAYALSALQYRFREVVFAVVVVSFMIPFEAVSIPLSTLFRGWHLQNTYWGLILPGIANGLGIFLVRQFFLGIPRELLEASLADGAGHWRILLRIYLPLSRPALIGAGLLLFIWQWQAYIWPLLIITRHTMALAPVALAQYLGEHNFNFSVMFAGALVLSVIPALILVPLQRYLTFSISHTGIKS